MNTSLAIALIALALASGFLGGMAVAKQEPPTVAAAAAPQPTPSTEALISACYQAPTTEGMVLCLRKYQGSLR